MTSRLALRQNPIRIATALVAVAAAACTGSPPLPSRSSSTVAIGSSAPSSQGSVVPAGPTRAIDVSTLRGRIAFSGGPPHGEDVYVINADGTGLMRVTSDPAAEFDPTWAPDGSQLAYRHQPGDDQTTDIFAIRAAGTGAHNVSGADDAPDWGPAWSPDGTWIAWNTAADSGFGFDLGLVHPDGTGRSVVRPGVFVEYPTWSPDGRRIAFMSQVAAEGSRYDIFVMNADGSDARRLTSAPADDGWPTWSPDGRSIAFSSTRDDCGQSSAPDCLSTGDLGPYHTLYVMAPDGSGQRRLSTVFAQIADWSPTGDYLVFEGRGGLTVTSADGAAIGTIPVGVGNASVPDWISPAAE
jgi:Tol biopolymer transport system component